MMVPMDTRTTPSDRLVVVPTAALDDLLELARLAADRMEPTDALAVHLRGAAAQVATSAVREPS